MGRRQDSLRALRVGLGLALTAAFFPSGAHAVGGPIVAAPGSFVTTYTTAAVVWTAGSPLQLVNLDIQPHDVVSEATRAPGTAFCPAGGPRCPLFRSPLAGLGDIVEVEGLGDVPSGVYLFRCTPHSWMEANLVVV